MFGLFKGVKYLTLFYYYNALRKPTIIRIRDGTGFRVHFLQLCFFKYWFYSVAAKICGWASSISGTYVKFSVFSIYLPFSP